MASLSRPLEKLILYFRGSLKTGMRLMTKLAAALMYGVMLKYSRERCRGAGWPWMFRGLSTSRHRMTVDAVLETVLIEVEDGLFVEMMDLQGFTRREMDEVRVVFVEGFFQKGDVFLVDGTAGEAEAQHAAVGASFAVAAEFAGNTFIFSGRQFFGVKSLVASTNWGKRLRISSLVSAVI